MNLRVIVIGTEDNLFVHNFSGFTESFDVSDIEQFDEDMCIETDSITNIFEFLFLRLQNEDFLEHYKMEEVGSPELSVELKNENFVFITHCLLDPEETVELNEYIKEYMLHNGLTFVNTEVISDENADDYLWLNYAIEGVDIFY